MGIHGLFVAASCLAVIPLTGKFGETLQERIGLWSLLVLIPIPLMVLYSVIKHALIFLPFVLVMLLMFITSSYFKYKD